MSNELEHLPILHETIAEVKARLGEDLRGLTVERAVIGLFFSGVKLSNGTAGICFTPVKEIPESVCCPSSAAAMPNAGRLSGRSVAEYLAHLHEGRPLKTALGIATLNALSETCRQMHPPEGYTITPVQDSPNDMHFKDGAYVVVVGALVPYLRLLKKRGLPFGILEKDERTLRDDEMPFYVPPDRAPAAIGRADHLIITGTTVLNGTLEGILEAARAGAEIDVVGPTVSMLPEAFFRRGVTSLGGVSCVDPDTLLDTLAEGGSGYHFFGRSAQQMVMRKKQEHVS
jgi:uncharacterized protein (DUF4213/DUF364 family)